MNPLGMVEAVIGALDHSAALEEQVCLNRVWGRDILSQPLSPRILLTPYVILTRRPQIQAGGASADAMKKYTTTLRKALHNTFRYGQGTRDMSGPDGLTTEQFVEKVCGLKLVILGLMVLGL